MDELGCCSLIRYATLIANPAWLLGLLDSKQRPNVCKQSLICLIPWSPTTGNLKLARACVPFGSLAKCSVFLSFLIAEHGYGIRLQVETPLFSACEALGPQQNWFSFDGRFQRRVCQQSLLCKNVQSRNTEKILQQVLPEFPAVFRDICATNLARIARG